MRVVIDARSRGSTGRYTNKLLEHLQNIDTENEYFVIIKSTQDWLPSAENFQVVINDAKDYTFSEQLSLWWTIRKLKSDVVHFTMPQQPILPLSTRCVTTIHDLTMLRYHNIDGNKLIYWFKLLVYRFLLWWVSHRSSAIITPTKWVKLDVIKTFKVDPLKIHITYESADPITARTQPIEELSGKDYLLFNGNVFPHKNIRRLIMAFTQLKKRHSKLKLVIAGKLNLRGLALQNEMIESGVKDVMWLGFVPDGEMKWLWTNALAYVYPSLSEGFGLPGLESMLVGTPVVSSNATCLPEVYGDAVEYFNPLSIDDMTQAIDRVISDPKRAIELVTAGKMLLKRYSWATTAQQTLSVYNQAIQPK
jgi:glycosyltransferase involved in cell wall biosynthesis